jgi:hypothetical protein
MMTATFVDDDSSFLMMTATFDDDSNKNIAYFDSNFSLLDSNNDVAY